MKRFLALFLLSAPFLLGQNINVQADASTGLLWRPAAIFSGNDIPTETTIDGWFADPSTNASFVASAWRTDLGLVIGTDVQAYAAVLAGTTASYTSAEETKLSGIETAADVTDTANVTAAGALMDSEVDADLKTLSLPATTTISAFGATIIDDAAATNVRATLGVDAAGTDNSTDVTLAGTGTYLSLAGQALTVDPITESDISDLTHTTQATRASLGLDTTDTVGFSNLSGTNTGDQNAAGVSVAATPSDYTAASANVESHLAGIDTALGSITSGVPDGDKGDITVSSSGTVWTLDDSFQPLDSALTNTTASYTTAEETKLSGIETAADVTDTANVTAAGALMDSEVDADIKTLTIAASSSISGTNTGDQTTVTGNAGTATTLQTARTIGGSSFDGSANVTSFPAPGAIGGTTPSTGDFTTLSATGDTTISGNVGIGRDPIVDQTVVIQATSGDNALNVTNSTATVNWLKIDGTGKVVMNGDDVSIGNDLFVTGALSKGSGSFRIAHPLEAKKATHKLVHSFIEGPRADLIYRGKVSLVNGTASVNIDEAATMTEGTFQVLCRDVQSFTSNESDFGAVRGSVSGNILTVTAEDNQSTAVISWMVIGERQDPHIKATGWTDEDGHVIVEPLNDALDARVKTLKILEAK